MANDNPDSSSEQTGRSTESETTVVTYHTGTSGNDDVDGDAGTVVVDMGAGDDDASSTGSGVRVLMGGSGNDTLESTASELDVVLGGSGADEITVSGPGHAVVFGGTGNDTIYGSTNDDNGPPLFRFLYGDDGDDVIYGGSAGLDWLVGGEGNDSIYGGDGLDLIFGGAGDDHLEGGAGSDSFHFASGHGTDTIGDFDASEDSILLGGFDGDALTWDVLQGKFTEVTDADDAVVATVIDLTEWGGGTIRLEGVSLASLTEDNFEFRDAFDPEEPPFTVNNMLPQRGQVDIGSDGNDTLDGGTGFDVLLGAEGDDSIDGGAGDDWLLGGEGADTLAGGEGNDTLLGGEGADSLSGGAGADTLAGGAGNDTLTGGAGADTFVYAPDYATDRVSDFANGEDVIDLTRFTGITAFSDLTLTQAGNDVVIDLSESGAGTLTLEGTTLSDIDAEDFVFYVAPVVDSIQDSM